MIIVEVAPQLPSQWGTDHSFQAQKSLSEQAGEIGQSETCKRRLRLLDLDS